MEDESRTESVPAAPAPVRRWAWIHVTVVLCLYGFFKELKPSEPFLTPFLVDSKNFSKAQVNSEIYPFWPYSYLVAALFVFLLTDLLRHKPIILVEAFSYLATRVLLIWGASVFSMQWMQVAYGVASASEIAYFSYIYPAVTNQHYQTVTSCIRAFRLFGQSLSSIVAQIVTSTGALTLLQLNYISMASVILSCVFALLIPDPWLCAGKQWLCTGVLSMDSSHRTQNSRNGKNFCVKAARDFKKFYTNLSLLKWSIWWALATCGYLQVGNYVQSLWKQVAEDSGTSHEFNGLVEALATFSSAIAALILSLLRVEWAVWGEVVIGVLSLVDSTALLIASAAHSVWIAYLCHILYRTTYSFLITIASVQLAHAVEHDSYGLIFGFNTFLSLILMTALTFTVADEHGFDLDIRTQFVVYSGYYYVLTLVFIGAGVYKLTSTGWLRSLRTCHIRQYSLPSSLTCSRNKEEEGEEREKGREGKRGGGSKGGSVLSENQPLIQCDGDSKESCDSITKLV